MALALRLLLLSAAALHLQSRVTAEVTLDLVLCRHREPLHEVVSYAERLKASATRAARVTVHLMQKDVGGEAAEPLAAAGDATAGEGDSGSETVAPSAAAAAADGAAAPPAAPPAGGHRVPRDWRVHLVPDRGHEEVCHLAYLANVANASASTHALFAHASLDEYAAPFVFRRLALLTERTGMLALAVIDGCECDGAHTGFEGRMVRLREIYALTQRRFCFGRWTSPFNGMFVVSRRRIESQPRAFYNYLLDLATTEQLHADTAYLTRPPPASAFFGHVMERAWGLVFSCLDLDRGNCCVEVDQPCPADGCQCLDAAVESGNATTAVAAAAARIGAAGAGVDTAGSCAGGWGEHPPPG